MAFGRGELWGQGLGTRYKNWSICRKRTLTLFSPLRRRTGVCRCGAGTFNGILRRFRAMSIGRKALEIDHRFSGFSPVLLASGLASRRWLT